MIRNHAFYIILQIVLQKKCCIYFAVPGPPLEPFPHPMVPADIPVPVMPLQNWDHPGLFTGGQEQILVPMYHQLDSVSPVLVAGPTFIGKLNEPICLFDPGNMPGPVVEPISYNFWASEPNWQPPIHPIEKWRDTGPRKPLVVSGQVPDFGHTKPSRDIGQWGGKGHIITWWNPSWNWGNNVNNVNTGNKVIPQTDWDFARVWATQVPNIPPNNNVWPDNTNGGVPQPQEVDVKTPPPQETPPQVEVNVEVRSINYRI